MLRSESEIERKKEMMRTRNTKCKPLVYRNFMTNVTIQHLTTEQKV